ncbi:response regulator [Elusimicrobiota bacterium]
MAKLLVAEDEESLLLLAVDNLEMAGYQIETAVNGEEAVEKVKAVMPDVVILDMHMPKKTGIEAAKILKSDPKTSHIPIILLTGSVGEEIINLTKTIGIARHMKKPYEPQELIAVIEELLRKRA